MTKIRHWCATKSCEVSWLVAQLFHDPKTIHRHETDDNNSGNIQHSVTRKLVLLSVESNKGLTGFTSLLSLHKDIFPT